MTETEKLDIRIQSLTEKLEVKSRQAPGLYPVQTQKEFLRIAVDIINKVNALDKPLNLEFKDYPVKMKQYLADRLEDIFRRPEEAYQLNAQSLIIQGKGLSDYKKDDNV